MILCSKTLYHNFAENLPIIDYHCPLSPKMIAENYQFRNAYELFLGGDHYKWRLMRSNGIDEEWITGKTDDYEKWLAFAKTVPLMIGNPMYHWTHLELKRYFDVDEPLSECTAKEIWDTVNQQLAQDEYRVQGLIRQSHVTVICTTDDPYSDLSYHKQLKEFDTKILPTFRPDLYHIQKDIPARMDYFHENGCRLCDHAVDEMNDMILETLIHAWDTKQSFWNLLAFLQNEVKVRDLQAFSFVPASRPDDH